MTRDERKELSRRQFLGVAGAGLAALSPLLAAACGGSGGESGGTESSPTAPTSAAATTAPPTTSGAANTPSGGKLRVGLVGGGTAETMDPYKPEGETSFARNHNHYDLLFDFDADGAPYEVLAEELSANADGTVWKIKVRPDVEFHSGKTLAADDVVYSLQHVLDKSLSLEGANDLYFVKPQNIRALDGSTVELTLDQPIGELRDKLASRALSIVPEGFTDFSKVDGTGPFKLESFTPGQRSLSAKFPNYRESGKPLLDELEIISVDDTAARVNALLTGQIDAAGTLDYTQVKTTEDAGFKILDAKTSGFQANIVCLTQAPFDDPAVRKAFRLLHDREAMVQTIYLGYGIAGNDMGMRFDPLYNTDVPQITYDPEQARSLLQQAGKEGLTIELLTSNAYPGMVESATLFKEQAKAGGLNVELKQQSPDTYYGEAWLAHPCKQTLWGQRSQDLFILQALDSNAPYNETCWMNPRFDKLTREGRATVDESRRKDLYFEAERILWDEGGFAQWGHGDYVDGLAANVEGIAPSSVRWLGWYTFKDAYLT